jgi:hypothetical protein
MNRESSSLSPPICPVKRVCICKVRWQMHWLVSRPNTSGSGSVVEHFLAKEDVAGSSPVSRFQLSKQRTVV